MAALRHCSFVVPGDLNTPTGGYRYDRRLLQALREMGWAIDVCQLQEGFPRPDAAALHDAQNRLAALPDGTCVVADGLAFGVLPELARRHAQRLRWVALVHHPLHLESGLTDAERETLQSQERESLASARHVIVTSHATVADVIALGVPAARITVVEPGTERSVAPRPAARDNVSLQLLCVATLTPRKGHAVLLQALSGLRALDWTLHCVGSPQHDLATAAQLHQASIDLVLADRVQWHGALEEHALASHYNAADLFVLPSFYEGYGMVIAEALAHGLPVITTTGGALARTLPRAAGLHVPPGDVDALRHALAQLIGDADLRARYAEGARAAGDRLPTWNDAAARFATVLEGVA
jgi:glycosyltransferase involved in cell wall biosynthesis